MFHVPRYHRAVCKHCWLETFLPDGGREEVHSLKVTNRSKHVHESVQNSDIWFQSTFSQKSIPLHHLSHFSLNGFSCLRVDKKRAYQHGWRVSSLCKFCTSMAHS